MVVLSAWTVASSAVLVVAVLLCGGVFLRQVHGETLTPPYFNLAEGKQITASATCGVDTEGPELYCKLVGANAENDLNIRVIQGQFCDFCDPNDPAKMHPPEFAVDGAETWWQSPPLSRGMKYNEVNLTIDLGQEFHVAYVYIRMGNSPRPGLWILEKSADYGATYTPWQYFSDSPSDCELYFGKQSLQPITKDDSVICETEYSKIVPLENGEIPISLLNNRPSANHYFNSSVLQEWTRATNVRLRFLRTKNLLGHLMSVARQDPTVTRRYFYSIKDISIGGRCMCNGHAESCDIQDPNDTNVLLCRCQHHTCGAKCDVCCPGYEQKRWRQSKHDHPFACEPCNCFLHSNECVYDEEVDNKHLSMDVFGNWAGGGVCQNCQHNTEGINCNKCIPTYYRPYNKHWNETDVCQPCSCNYFYSTGNCAEGSGRCECRKEFLAPNCDSCSFGYFGYPDCRPCECFLNGTRDLQCEAIDGQCPCLYNFGGRYCKECSKGFYNFPECQQCECNPEGSQSQTCEQETGNCTCKNNFGGKHCDQCQDGYFGYPSCSYCKCDVKGTKEGICDKETGECICKDGYGGEKCDVCLSSYYGYPDCQPCNCTTVGTIGNNCSPSTGKCQCKKEYAGKICDQCSPGYYKFPDCLPCDCDPHGTNGVSCDGEGMCECFYNFDGPKCNQCKEGFYNYPDCEDCNCNPAGVVAGFAGCGSVPAGELCKCKERVEGRICNKCRPLFWNLNHNNPQGCEECNCNVAGTLGGLAVCDTDNGQCECKSLVMARGCTECIPGTYNLQEENLFGCTDCDCDVGGSISNNCDRASGQCSCHNRVTGRTCKEPLQAHYFPTLYQYQYEVEDGHTPAHTLVRHAYDEHVFPDYSWKGYAVFSQLQNKILQDIFIYKSSLYRMVLRYVNRNPETVIGTIKITPENPSDNEQEFKVQFKNSAAPAFVTVSGATGNIPSPFVMNPGRWQISIEVTRDLLVDYFVLLPEDFYLATVLTKKVESPCTVNATGLCRDYTYLNVTSYDHGYGASGFTQTGRKINRLKEFFQDNEHLGLINVGNKVPLLNLAQPDVSFNFTVRQPGQYVLVVNYVIPLGDQRTHRVTANVTSGRSSHFGNVIFYSCPYSTLCRQVITNQWGGVGVFPIDDAQIRVDLHSENADVGVHSIAAIPFEEWSLDYIRPKSVCVKKDGNCIQTRFITPPDTKKVQFEENYPTESTTLANTNSTYVLLNPALNIIDLKGKVPTPGYYTFILHYYQPNFQDFEATVLVQNGQFYEAKVPVLHCPSLSGCRSVVTQAGGNNKFALTENFMFTIKEPGNKNVYLDYLLVVPTDYYTHRYLDEEDVDRTGEFLSTCASNNFNIDTTVEGFCRDSVFSITADHNSGSLKCQCDYDGSQSFKCDKFGGQCECKPNIIGRRCEACKTGYFGFPDCKPCNCPSTAYCQPNTGQCICPPHVTGERCDQCEPLTYGFDPIIGCEECKCNPLGVDRSLQCDLTNGSCPCKPHIVGRQCDICEAGFYAYPYCESCDCYEGGTIAEICDQQTAECFCKKNVIGPQCERCRDGSFNLQPENEDGCTECFCFGKSKRCDSSQLINTQLNDMNGWEVTAVNTSLKLEKASLNLTVQKLNEYTVGVDFYSDGLTNITVYFKAPPTYLGKKLTTYGGLLNYTIFYTIGSGGSAVGGPDVILEGRKTYLTFSSYEQPPQSIEYPASVQLVESNFDLPTGVAAKRDHIMEVLEDLRGVYIRANYWSASVTTSILNVIQDDAIPFNYYNGDNRRIKYANSVEQCICPPNYQGLSCEECAPGYYRIESGSHGGSCVPCQCHNHASECDVNTGVCLNCTHHTHGDHCEMCEVGYHGKAEAGTPMDCLICACPQPYTSNNFATSCDLSSDGEKISCKCKEGYAGGRCQSCASGYYGRPDVLGDYCKPCQCSGNIDPNEKGACDTETGECLKCLNNTFGNACALCAPGFFGDAVGNKDCQSCLCDQIGMHHCNSYTGVCVCQPNVVGEKCDRCADNHYNFTSGQGCTPCNCGEASLSDRCDDNTGNCRCQPGVSGRNCDRCSAGFWNYTSEGCVSCGCKSEYSLGFGCNAMTGQCECLQGVVGEKCDQCPHRWVFVPEYGCHRCDSCTHHLLDTTDELRALIDPVIQEFDSANSGFFTRRKLANMQNLLKELRPKFAEVDPKQVEIGTYLQELAALEQDAKNLHRKSNYSLDNSDSSSNSSDTLKQKAEELLVDLTIAEDESFRVIDGIGRITFQLNKEDGQEIEGAVLEGQELLNQIKIYDLSERQDKADDLNRNSTKILETVINFKIPVENLDREVQSVKKDLKEFNDALDDLHNQTQWSLNKANDAQQILDRSGKDRLKKKLADIGNETQHAKDNLDLSQNLNEESREYNQEAGDKLYDLQNILNDVKSSNNEFESILNNNEEEIVVINDLKPKVERHANNLTHRVMDLDNLLSETRDISDHALQAANAYKDIVKAVDNARTAALDAERDSKGAADKLVGVDKFASEASQESSAALEKANNGYSDTRNELEPLLDDAIAKYVPVESTHGENAQLIDELETILSNIKRRSLDALYEEAGKNADRAIDHVDDIEEVATETFQKLPSETKQANELDKSVFDANNDIQQTAKQLGVINERFPRVQEALKEIPARQNRLQKTAQNIESSLNTLNQQIALARDLANQIKIGMRFYPSTTLELRNPPKIEDQSNTKISGYFRTKELDGLILYFGNPVGTDLRRTKSDDYLAFLIQNGYPILKLDVGNGPQEIVHDKFVSDNVWRQFVIERTGHNAKLSIVEELYDGTSNVLEKEATLEGGYTIFNIDKNKSKIFVGSFHDVGKSMQPEIGDINSFDGEIEDLVFGDTPVSLWNFDYGYDNNHGAFERDKLINLKRSTGFRFNGNGYVVLNIRSYAIRQKSQIQLDFKTFATEGLLFLAKAGNTFISLELRNGKLIYQYNLGSGTKKFATSKTYNDGQWHQVRVLREESAGRFYVDTEEIRSVDGEIFGTSLEAIDTMSFGGHPVAHHIPEVTETKFDGCIDNVLLMGSPLDLLNKVTSYDVVPGCSVKVARTVSFAKNRPGYLSRGGVSVSNNFKISLRFKTKESNGLIFYISDNLNSASASLSLKDGRLVLISQKIQLATKDTFNDSDWHVVSVMHDDVALRIDIDDYITKTTDSPPPALHILHGELYLGSVPRKIALQPNSVGSATPFIGCIGDLTFNGNVINFANSTDKHNDILGRCILDENILEPDEEVHKVPALPDLEASGPVAPPDEVTRSPYDEVTTRKSGGDGGFDEAYETTPAEPERPPYRPPPSTPAPDKKGCALPIHSTFDTNTYAGSYRFGLSKVSRLEFVFLRGRMKKEFDFDLDFNTTAENGIIFYISDNVQHTNFIAVTLQDGYVVFAFKSQGGMVVIRSDLQFNDGNWHSLKVSRSENIGSLRIDEDHLYEGSTTAAINRVDVKPPVFVGGVRPADYNVVQSNLNVSEPLKGCIREINMNNRPLETPEVFGTMPCSDNVEPGIFSSGGDGSYIKIKERFRVGEIFNIKLDIKPRTNTGVLIAVHGKRDYFILELVNGSMKLTVENGRGPITTYYHPKESFYFCDGAWHSIQAVKSKNVVTLSVDNVFGSPSLGDHHSTSTDTGSALFLGGHRLLKRVRGIVSREAYVGCIKGIMINNEEAEILPAMAEGNITVGYCPTD